MPTVKVRNLKNKEVGDVELSDAVFGVALNESLIHAAVLNYRANGRSGNSATKTRGNVSGSGRKLWKQKARAVRVSRRFARLCGRAAATFTGRSHATGRTRCRRKCVAVRCDRHCLRGFAKGTSSSLTDLSSRIRRPATFSERWAHWAWLTRKRRTKTLIVDSLDNANLILSSRNVEKTKVTNSFGLNIYDIIYHEKLLISKAAVEELNDLLDPKREGTAVEEAVEAKPAAKPKSKKAEKPAEEAVAEEKPKAKKEAAPKAEKPAEKAAEEKPKAKKVAKPKAEKVEAAPVEEIAPLDTENPLELPEGETPLLEEGEGNE